MRRATSFGVSTWIGAHWTISTNANSEIVTQSHGIAGRRSGRRRGSRAASPPAPARSATRGRVAQTNANETRNESASKANTTVEPARP